MKRVFIFLTGFLLCIQQIQAQQQTWTEDFDGTLPPAAWAVSSSSLTGSWLPNTTYHQPGSSTTNPQSYRGKVPNDVGEYVSLETRVYNLEDYEYGLLRFSHICKVSPSDTVRVEYRINQGTVMGPWLSLPWSDYMGSAANYRISGFNAASYSEWRGNDSTIFPAQSWWKEEIFDLRYFATGYQVQFRFFIKHGNTPGTQVSYGWLIDNLEVTASVNPVNTPAVNFVSPLIKDTLYSVGPYTINAKVATRTTAKIKNPWLKYTATNNGNHVKTDSILMENVSGDSLWKAQIKAFPLGTDILYSILGEDTVGNYANAISGYAIRKSLSDTLSNSTAMYSIDLATPVATTTNHQVPIVVTIKNKGISDLHSATISYTINGDVPEDYNWNKTTGLPWDYTSQDTIGYYTPKMKGYDTITAWIKMPNSVEDTIVFDDSLTKITYGTTDIQMRFVKAPGDTVYSVGPHTIGVRIETLSGNTIPSVTLNVASTYEGVTSDNTYPMVYNANENSWEVDIPSHRIRTSVKYSVTLTDILGNEVSISREYYIKKTMIIDELVGSFYFSPLDTMTNSMSGGSGYYFQPTSTTSWARSLYLYEDFTDMDTVNTRVIGSYGVRLQSTGTYTCKNVRIYLQEVLDTEVALGYVDPVGAGAQLVYEGPWTLVYAWINGPGAAGQFNEVIFQTPFLLKPKHNLLVYVEYIPDAGSIVTSLTWPVAILRRSNTVTGAPIGTGGNSRVSLIAASFGIATIKNIDTNSVALKSILSPVQDDIQFTNPTDVTVEIMNLGIGDLDSCEINWTLNGVLQEPPYIYRGPLWEGFNDIVTIGSYTAIAGRSDEIVVWVSMPNGKVDLLTYDDTLQTTIAGCTTPLNGVYRVGNNAPYYRTLSSVFFALERCGISGKVTLELESQTFEESAALGSAIKMTMADTLEIRSLSGNASDVVIYPSEGAGLSLLGEIKNFSLQGITIDSRRSGSHGIEILNASQNTTIKNCTIYAKPTSSATTASSIYVRGGIQEDISIVKNLIDGGYAGIYIYGGTGSSAYGTNIIIDSNTIQNHYSTGLYTYYADFTSISHNTVLSSASSVAADAATTWNGLSINYSNGPITGNKVIQQGTRITNPTGIYTYQYHYYPTRTLGVVANNEIIVSTTGAYHGINIGTYSRGYYLHNSIYVKGTSGSPRGITIASSAYSSLFIKNNNIVMESPSGYPIHMTNLDFIALIDLDYNNMYGSNYVGFIGNSISSIPVWQQLVPTDKHSVKVLPAFIDITESLELTNYSDLFCLQYSQAQDNIKGEQRTARTTIGAYGIGLPDGYDLSLKAMKEPAYSSCSPDYVPVKVELSNNGSVKHDFSANPITLHLNVTGRLGLIPPFDTAITINYGQLDLFESIEYMLKNLLNVSVADEYLLSAWITNSMDPVKANDTIRETYSTVKIFLPLDENFSNGIPSEFTVKSNTSSAWTPVAQGIGADTSIKPVYGTSMLMFNGTRGARTELISAKIELQGMISPALDLWYFHDTTETEDYLDVRITLDGESYTTIQSLSKQNNVRGWKHYSIDLSSYMNGSCINILFEAMSLSGEAIFQYIDRVLITAKQDIKITEVFISDFSVCDMKNKEWKVVLKNLTQPVLSYDNTPTEIVLEIIGTPHRFTKSLQTGSVAGLASDTIPLSPYFDIAPGVYDVKVYFASPLDDNPLNDTLTGYIDINPDIKITVHKLSGQDINCLGAGMDAFQSVTIENIGNMELSNIRLILQVDTGSNISARYSIMRESLPGSIAPGQSVNYEFSNGYIVPGTPNYQVLVTAYLSCDSAMVNNASAVNECVETDNLAVTSIDNPSGQMDSIGNNVNIEVTLENRSDVTSFSNIAIHARVEDSKGTVVANISETISGTIDPLSPEHHTFSTPYTVPDDSVYYITVFIEKQAKDNYQRDDTIQAKRITNHKVGIESRYLPEISMEQNIPNPANNNTIIRYSIPESGEVIFRIHSINGQLLYNKAVPSEPGINSIEVNTSTLSAGIYMYSMEYKGQRIVKRMSIKR